MSPPPDTPPRSRRARGLRTAVLAGLVVVSLAVFALDRLAVEEHRRQFRAGPADPSSLRAPTVEIWLAKPLDPDSPAPEFTLPDARSGERVSLADFRGDRPVVVLLSSFG